MRTIKHTAIGIAAFVVLAAAVSCGDATGNDAVTTAAGNETQAVTETTEPTRAMHKVPVDSLDFGGEELNQATIDWQGYQYYFFAEEENGDVMNDAVYARTAAVEEALNVKLVHEVYPADLVQYESDIKKFTMAGDDVYDMVFGHCIQAVATFATGGHLYNLDDLPHIDMQAEWWNRRQMDVLRLGQNTYYAVNDMMIPCPYVIFFNKEMVSKFDMTDPYELVYSGKWTLDKFEEMARAAVSDVNGDGKMDENDSWGVSAWDTSNYISFMTGSGQFITEMGEDNRVQLALNTEKTQSIIERFADMAKTDVIYGKNREDMLTIRTERLMFQIDAITTAENMRDCEVDFGYLPFPKYDEAQEDYITLDWGGLMCVPCTITNPEMVGAAMELLAWESKNVVIPTYYDTVLTGKLARDDDAVKMMDILFDTVAYEIGGNYFGFSSGMFDLFYCLPKLAIEQKSSDFSSFYTKKEKATLKTIESFYENLENTESAN